MLIGVPTDSQNLAHSVIWLARRLRQERRSDLTPGQLAVLGALSVQGPLTPRAIAAHERVQPPSITRTVNCLADAGLVIRTPHPEDGRQRLIGVSEKGTEVLVLERARRDQWLAESFNDLTVDERAWLRKATGIMAQLART